MTTPFDDGGYGSANLAYVEQVYQRFLEDPHAVDDSWRKYFEGLAVGLLRDAETSGEQSTGTYDKHVAADAHPVIYRIDDAKPVDGLSGSMRDILRRAPLFQGLGDDHLAALAQIAEELTVGARFFLCRRGQEENDLYFIEKGHVAIERDGAEITWLGPGELVGELAVFDRRARSADVVTKEPCLLLRIPRVKLLQLLSRDQELSLHLLRILSLRLRDAGKFQERVDRMVNAYRELGHLLADLDPLGLRRKDEHPELSLAHYNFNETDLNVKFTVQIGKESSGRSLRDIRETLQSVYCRFIGAQYMHIDDLEIQEWIRVRLEEEACDIKLPSDEQQRILRKLTDAEVFEKFLDKKFKGQKRFSLEGSESLIPLLDYAIEKAGDHGVDEVIIGMAHRGRLNVLVNVMDKPATQVFREFRDVDPHLHRGRGDVKYHLGYGANRETESGRTVHLSLCFNPSHLEFVSAVAMGRARAKQDRFGDVERRRALPLLIHGDASFIGQGVVQELFNLSELEGYRVGGSVHVILNNQIGFTTDPEEARSSRYATDVARMLQIPIFHVNGEHPEAVALVIRLAMDFREQFNKDVVIDMYGYRRHGHNEGDDPTFTQPEMYRAVKKKKGVRRDYVDNLLQLGGVSADEAETMAQEAELKLDQAYQESIREDYRFSHHSAGAGLWEPFHGGFDKDVEEADTKTPADTLRALLIRLASTPDSFQAHPKLARRHLQPLRDMAEKDAPLNWGAGEALAFATLIAEGASIRVTGQDAERGTFSHRHAVLHDYQTNARFAPLRDLAEERGARFEIHNSVLSETAVLGFEYGYSLDTPDGLTVWEAQFGDFCNVAQVIIDQFISSSEEKWRRLSGLVLLLPHGFEGQGPEHSSARLERFLMLSAVDNMQVVNLTTAAQIFHCLRRQVRRSWRKPLIVMSPKSLLRDKRASSPLRDLAEGYFHKIIQDEDLKDPSKVARVLLCSGKIYYELRDKRTKGGVQNIAILRMEQYYPLPREELEAALQIYPNNTPLVWVQEEPRNMGAWPFLKLHLGDCVEAHGLHPLRLVSRPEAASPATGSKASHDREQQELIERALSF